MEGVKIFVLDRGHVKAAVFRPHPELAFHWQFLRCRVIRKWGTSKGLAQLQDGPLPDTKLDAPHSSTVPFRAVLDVIDLTPAGEIEWKKLL